MAIAPRPLARRTGLRAEEAWLRARIAEARASVDFVALRQASVFLARWLASRDRDLDEAVELAAGALQLGQDVELRRELSGWLESLGDPARAADILKPLASLPEVESTDAAYVLVRVGILRARAGSAAAAASAFEAALSVDGIDPLPSELLAALSSWDPDAVPAVSAVQAYVESARRRSLLQQRDAELLDLWRAFSADSSSDIAARALADALERRARVPAADEVLRMHAMALAKKDPLGAARVHARRRASAILAREPRSALEAALDEGIDACLDGEESHVFDALLLDLGMLDALAARLELRTERASGPTERAFQFVELGTLRGGPLADRRGAARAYVSAFAADPTSEEAMTALRGLIETYVHAQPDPGGTDASGSESPFATIVASVATVGDESQRRAILVARLERAWPGILDSEDDSGSNDSDSEEAVWVRESIAGRGRAKAAALERVAALQSAPLRAVLLAAAAVLHLAAGDATAARGAAEVAIRADPTSVRCVAVLADAAAAQHGDRSAATALERAIGMIGPRISWCFALANVLEDLGERAAAAGWTLRCASLRPGNGDATRLLLERLHRAGDSSRLSDALAWLLTQPRPVGDTAQPFADALAALARLDVDRARVIGRRALDVFGPKSGVLREAMLGVADRASDDAFAAAILERWLSSNGRDAPDRREVLGRLAELRVRIGDEEGHARIAARAVGEGFGGPEFQSVEHSGDRPVSPDAQLWQLRTTAGRLSGRDDAAAAVWAWRDFGAALWDMAEDRVGAIEAWQRASQAVEGGYTTLALDLVAMAGVDFAFDYLARLADAEPDDAVSASIGTAASRVALSVGEARFAFDLAARVIRRRPGSTDALDAAETATQSAGEQAVLSELYDLVAVGALGRFGRRAAHYRGARWFERHGLYALALTHAAQAFVAVPSEGSALQFLARMADLAGDRALAVRTIEQVADREQPAAIRAAWLLRAASIAGDGEEATRRKFDLLLRATIASPSVATVGMLRDVARAVLRFGPEERDGLELRIGHVSRSVSGRLAGPEGARVAIAFATTLLELFADGDGALRAVEGAFACDADIDEYGTFARHAAILGRSPGASARIAAMLATAESPHANVGISALGLLAAIADAAGDARSRARASIAAALRAPDDDRLTIEADDALRAMEHLPGQADLPPNRLTPGRRSAALLAAARSRAAAGSYGDAASLFERAFDLLDAGARPDVEHELRAALDAGGRGSEIEARAYREAIAEGGPAAGRAASWTQVAELRERRGDTPGAVRALLEACRLDPEPLERWSSLERVAEIAGEDDAQVEALEEIGSRVKDEGRVTVLKRLARAQERRGDLEAAEKTWRLLLALDAEDDEADQAMQSVIVARGDYDELVAHLARRADRLRGNPDKRELLRAVRLRRAAILEQRLGRTKDACIELELLLSEWPDSVGAIRYLADLFDRQSDFSRSVPLWRRAAALEDNPVESDELGLRAARAARAASDLSSGADDAIRVLAIDYPSRFVEPGADARLHDLEAAIHEARSPSDRSRARLALARGLLDFGDAEGAEPLLWEALADGIIEAGDLLAPLLASWPDRAAELVKVRWRLVSLEPGELDRLESLRVAALADDDPVHARAVEHVLRAFDHDAGSLLPPSLAAQSEQQGILGLLTRPSTDAAGEALALLWEGAMQLFVRDAASYGITGVERVLPGPSSPVARLYEVAMRLLDVPRIPLFVTRSANDVLESHVALMSPPAVILVGDVRNDRPDLSFELGRGIAAALPCNVLRRALPRADGWAVIEALRTAFGPPELGRHVDPSVARLAESFWQIIPASVQRRLQDLLRTSVLPDHAVLVEAALQSGRRVGMFLAGDFACAVRMALAESPGPHGTGGQHRPMGTLPTRENLRALCSSVPAIADLLCLAVSSEYADARWHSITSASRRGADSSGRFRVF